MVTQGDPNPGRQAGSWQASGGTKRPDPTQPDQADELVVEMEVAKWGNQSILAHRSLVLVRRCWCAGAGAGAGGVRSIDRLGNSQEKEEMKRFLAVPFLRAPIIGLNHK